MNRLHPKEIILGFSQDGVYKAYKQNDVESKKIINDSIDNNPIMLGFFIFSKLTCI